MIRVRPFARHDWYGYAGAERFADGSEPRVGEIVVDGVVGEVIWDAHGVEVLWVQGDADRWLLTEVERGFAPALLEAIPAVTTGAELRAIVAAHGARIVDAHGDDEG